MQILFQAFALPGIETQLDAELETDTYGFEKGNIRLNVKVAEVQTPQGIKNFQRSILQIYILRNLVHQAGGQLTLCSVKEENQIEFYILLPIKSASSS